MKKVSSIRSGVASTTRTQTGQPSRFLSTAHQLKDLELTEQVEDLTHALLDAMSARAHEASFMELIYGIDILVDKLVLLQAMPPKSRHKQQQQ